MSSLSINQLSKSFIQASHVTNVLDRVSYTFDSRQTTVITGVSGTGKSTVMHLLAGIDKPNSGTVLYNGDDIGLLSKRTEFLQKKIGLMFQVPYLIDELSVVENVMIKGLIANESYALCKERALELLQYVHLVNKAEQAPRTLSGGEQQRVALARALFMQPEFILADEPTAHLDAVTKSSIIDLLLTCHKEWNMGLIIASHDESFAEYMDVVLCLEGGKLIEKGNYLDSTIRNVDQLRL